MASGGKETHKEEQKSSIESISDEKIALMIDIINQHSSYKVVTTEEFNKIKTYPAEFATSTPAVRSRQMPTLTPPPIHDLHATMANENPNVSQAKPRIPIFSGEEKSEVNFDVWKYEVKCIIREGNYSEIILRQSIRGSLKGKARSLLLSLSDNATPSQIIDKLEGVYGNVFSSEALLQRFYSENQQPNQSVAEYGMQLESLIQLAVEKGQINPAAKNEMLRSKFWSGLRDPSLKNASRYKYDTVMDFDQLRKEIRSIELDLSNYARSDSTEKKVQQHATTIQSDKLDELSKSINTLNKKLENIEGEIKKMKEPKKTENQNEKNSGQGYRGYNRSGRFNRGQRGSFRGRGSYNNYSNQGQNKSDNLNG